MTLSNRESFLFSSSFPSSLITPLPFLSLSLSLSLFESCRAFGMKTAGDKDVLSFISGVEEE